MTTLHLWRAILAPWGAHPLFWQIAPYPFQPEPRHPALHVLFGAATVGAGFVAAALLIPLPLYLLAGLIFGAKIADAISGVIAREKARRRYDLLCATPPGEFGVMMIITRALFRRQRTLFGFRLEYDLLNHLLLGVGMSAAVLIANAGGLLRVDAASVGGILLAAPLIALLLHADFRQSLTLGVMFGLLASRRAANRLNARLLALTGYAAVQIVLFTAAFLFDWRSPPGAAAALVMVFAVRECVVIGAGWWLRR